MRNTFQSYFSFMGQAHPFELRDRKIPGLTPLFKLILYSLIFFHLEYLSLFGYAVSIK